MCIRDRPTTSVLKRREVPFTVSSFSVSATTTAVSFASILWLLLLLRRDMHFCFLVVVLLLLIIFLVGCAAAASGTCAAYKISTEAERGTGYCFFFLRYCPLQCDALHVYCCCCSWLLLFLSFRPRCFGWLEIYKGCTPAASATTKRDINVPGTYTNFSFSFSVWWDIPTSAFFHSRAFCLHVNRLFKFHN